MLETHDNSFENTSNWGLLTFLLNFEAYFNKLFELIWFNFSILFAKQCMNHLDSLFGRKITSNFISKGVQEPLCMSPCYFYLSWTLYAFSDPLDYSLDSDISFHHISMAIIIEKENKVSIQN